MRRLFLTLLCGVTITCLMVGCTSRSGGPSGTTGVSGGREVIAVIPKSTGAEFWETVEEGAQAAAEELGVEMKWEGTLTETEIAEQNKIIENMVNLDVDGIALAPLNFKATKKSVQFAVDAGIPVIVFDSAVDGDAHTSFVATNNTQGGAMGAQHMAELLGADGGRVMVMRFVQGTASTEARAAGFIEAAEAAGIQIVADPFPEDGTVAGGKKAAANTLEGFIKDGKLELDGIFACNDRATLGTLEALGDLEKSGIEVNVQFVGFDFTPRIVDSLLEDKIQAIVAQNPRKMGYLAVTTLVSHLRGEAIEAVIDTGVELVTKERAESEAEIGQLIGLDK